MEHIVEYRKRTGYVANPASREIIETLASYSPNKLILSLSPSPSQITNKQTRPQEHGCPKPGDPPATASASPSEPNSHPPNSTNATTSYAADTPTPKYSASSTIESCSVRPSRKESGCTDSRIRGGGKSLGGRDPWVPIC